MRRLVAIIALLAGASVLAPVTNADAAMRPAGLRTAAAHAGLLMPEVGGDGHSQPLPGGFVLVQYNNEGGGGGGGYGRPYNGGGGGYSRPSNGGGYNRPYNGGGYSRQNHGGGNNAVNGAAAVLGIITILRQQQIMQQQQELLKQQQHQQYNDHLKRGQARREQELHNERAKENERKVNLEKAKKEERLQEELEETKKELNDKNRAHNYPPATPQPVPGPVDHDPYHDRVGDIVVNIIPAPDNCPDNFQELRVGATVLYPRRTDFPADRSLCAGVTEKGCYLKVENTPATCGASRQVCVARCPNPLPTRQADIRPPYVAPKPIVPPPPVVIPTPAPVVIPTPAGCNGGNCPPPPCTGGNCGRTADLNCTDGNCSPQQQTQPVCTGGNCPPPPCTGGDCGRTADLDCNGGSCAPQPVVTHPKSTKKTQQAQRTEKANKYVQPKPTKTAQRTEKANKYVQPKPTKTAQRTDKANKYVQPKPTKTALRTDKANKYVQPKSTKTTRRTDKPQKPSKQAQRTDKANKYVQPKRTKTAQRTDKARSFSTLRKGLKGFRQAMREDDNKDQADQKKEQEQADEDKLERTPDSRGCTKHGGVPKAWLRNSKSYEGLMQCLTNDCKPSTYDIPTTSFIAPNTALRDAVTETLSNVPEVGALLSGVAQELWGDPTTPALFDQMQSYVGNVVPQMIEQAETDRLKGRLKGLMTALNAYKTTKNVLTKGEKLQSLDTVLSALQEDFVDPSQPEKRLAYFVAFATMKLAVLREEYLHTKDYSGDNADLAGNLKLLNAAIDDFKKKAQDIKQRALAERLSHIHVDRRVIRQSSGWGAREKIWAATAKDDRCDWPAPTYEHNEFAYCYDHWRHPEEHPCDASDQTINADKQAARRKEIVAKAYGDDLDLILAPITHWASSTEMAHKVVAQAAPARGGAK